MQRGAGGEIPAPSRRGGCGSPGHASARSEDDALRLVFNFTAAARPRPFRRKGKGTFLVTVAVPDRRPDNILKEGYPLLIRSLGNLMIYLVRSGGHVETHFVTLEQGTYQRPDLTGDAAGGGRPAPGGVGLAAPALPDARTAPRPRHAAHPAPLRPRRPLLRQPERAEGRHPLLDERLRRGQGAHGGDRAGHAAGQGLRSAAEGDAPERPAACPAAPGLGGPPRSADFP